MNSLYLKIAAAISVIAGLSAGTGYWIAQRNHAMNASSQASMKNSADSREALYWYDPMTPNQHFDHPGKSPFMDMQLVPKYADIAGQDAAHSGINIDSNVMQNLGIRLATVQRGVVAQSINATGNLVFNQRDVAVVQTRTNGFVVRVYDHAPSDVIGQHAPLVDLLVPEWAGAQAEFLALLKSDDPALIIAARERLVLTGMPPELIASIEKTRQQQTTITITTPIAGVIDSLEVRVGMTLGAGATLATIKGLKTVWLEAQIPEAQSELVKVGSALTAMLAAYPGEAFKGKVIAVLPEAAIDTRTVRVRVELPNPKQRLRPGMFAQVHLDTGNASPMLFLPSEAIIRSGTRNMVIARTNGGTFKPIEVQLGAESAGNTIVLAGLIEGQQVVASGQFLIDSEANLQGMLTQLNEDSVSTAQPAGSTP